MEYEFIVILFSQDNKQLAVIKHIYVSAMVTHILRTIRSQELLTIPIGR